MILDKFRLDNKIAIVTGCSRGIGKAYATALAEAGADIVGVASKESFASVEREITSRGRTFKSYVSDFSDRKSLYGFIENVKSDYPRIDVLVNNAGTILRKPASEHPDEYWDKVMEVNLTAQFILTREIGKEMAARGNGKIVFVASLLSFQGGIFVPSYSASKGGVKQLMMAFANEWASKGVNVNAIAPGYIETENTAALLADKERDEAIRERIPAGRWGAPEDLMGPIVFLCSDASSYMNGTVVTVDGGWMSR